MIDIEATLIITIVIATTLIVITYHYGNITGYSKGIKNTKEIYDKHIDEINELHEAHVNKLKSIYEGHIKKVNK